MYRERAEYCSQMAEKAITDEVKADWLQIADIWTQLAISEELDQASGGVTQSLVYGSGRSIR
jgi:hypothetical protein